LPGLSPADVEYQFHKAAPPGQDSHEPDTLWRTFPTDTSAFPLHAPRGNTYDLALRYRFQPETTSHYTVTVSQYWWGSAWFLSSLAGATGMLAVLLAFLAFQRVKRRQEASKEKATQALRSVQAQLNPHFIFNALTSIQGLINLGETDAANQYLSAFAVLMRNTLADHERITNRLGPELKSMETYLSLEQLRFHFQFSIRTDEALDAVEIPRLLLQPIIENAVKHGVSALRERGMITITASARSEDLVIAIHDNGPGFQEASTGYGLKLTADRLRLVNQLHPEIPIHMTRSEGPGATFTFIFIKWLV
jgi:two-component system LytT family sensor kinase